MSSTAALAEIIVLQPDADEGMTGGQHQHGLSPACSRQAA